MKPKVLVAYFSHSGNTKKIAQLIQKQLGCDVFEIVPTEPYPTNYGAVLKLSREEHLQQIMPKFFAFEKDMSAYDVVILGFPIWWETMPMVVQHFLMKYDFAGKKILPYSTHESSGLGESVEDIRYLCPDAEVVDEFDVQGALAFRAEKNVRAWLKRVFAL